MHKLRRHAWVYALVAACMVVFSNSDPLHRQKLETRQYRDVIQQRRPFHNARNRSVATADEILELLSRVRLDLSPWEESGITLEMVERAYCAEDNGEAMRVQIIDGQVYIVPPAQSYQSRARTVQLQFAALSQDYLLPDVDFIIYTSDTCPPDNMPHRSHDGKFERCPTSAPLLTADKRPPEKCVLAPDFTFGGWPEVFLPMWPVTWGLLAESADHSPWDTRSNKVFWKGAFTSIERRMVAESHLIQGSPHTNIHLMDWESPDLEDSFVSLPDHCYYKYLLHMAGVAYSSRLKYLMSCKSVVFFPQSDESHQEFWYHMLDDSNHVPVPTVTDENQGAPLLELIEQLVDDPERAHRIATAGQHLAKEILHPDNVDRYWLELLSQYNALQRFKVRLHADAVPIEKLLLRPDLRLPNDKKTCNVC